jgi:hypothetical protein
MKNILVVVVLALSNFALAEETVRFKCSPFKNANGDILVGVSAPEIVSLDGSKDLYVKTSVVYPNATPHYDKLTKVSQHIEGSEWESETYSVHIFYMAGSRAHIQRKGSKIIALCKGPNLRR